MDPSQSKKAYFKLIKKSRTPTLEELSPYREALVLCHYKVVNERIGRGQSAHTGFEKGQDFVIAHWGVYGNKDQNLAGLTIGKVSVLEVQPLDNFKDLETVQMSNDLGNESLAWPLYLDVAQHRLMKDPQTAEKYGMQTYKMRDFHTLRHQLKLFALGDSPRI